MSIQRYGMFGKAEPARATAVFVQRAPEARTSLMESQMLRVVPVSHALALRQLIMRQVHLTIYAWLFRSSRTR